MFLRSPHARATISGIDTAAALQVPGVVAVYTGADLAADAIGDLPCGWLVKSKDGSDMIQPPHPPLAVERVNYVGEPYGVVIADSLQAARDGAEAVATDFNDLPAVVESGNRRRSGPGACVGPEHQCYDWELGDKAAHRRRLRQGRSRRVPGHRQQSPDPNAMEPRAAVGDYDAASGGYTLYTTSQNPHLARLVLAASCRWRRNRSCGSYRPMSAAVSAPRYSFTRRKPRSYGRGKLRRPVKWRAERSRVVPGGRPRPAITSLRRSWPWRPMARSWG